MAATAVLLDLDGTLWDSYPWYASVLARSGRLAVDEAITRLRAGESVVTLARECAVTRSRFARACREDGATAILYPGVCDGLRELEGLGVALGVVTSLPGCIAGELLARNGVAGFFPVVVDASSRAYKPSPRPILLALRQMGLGAGPGVYYVGDTDNDAKAACRAGIAFAWASYGYGSACPPGTTTALRQFTEVVGL